MKIKTFCRVSWLLLLFAWPALAEEASPSTAAVNPSERLTQTIDRRITEQWTLHDVQPAELAGDAEFLRRVYLDLGGCIPPVSEVRAFLDAPAADKRQRLVERLLDSPAYVTHFTNVWRRWLLSEADTTFEARYMAPNFEVWLRKQIVENSPYDAMVRELLTVSLNDGQQNIYGDLSEPTPIAFFLAKENKPENLAASTARLFLGVRLECAQCHDHPFAHWKRHDFWSQAAFFASVESRPQGGLFAAFQKVFQRREIAIPGTSEIVEARYLSGDRPSWEFQVPARDTLAQWMTSRENPYFARATVNRLWAAMFGLGLVEPVDDMDDHNPPSHPELLAELSEGFADSGFDVKVLLRSIALSQAYQRSSRQTHQSQLEPRRFARMAVRGLSPEQLVESLVQATGFREPPGSRNPFAQGSDSPRSEVVQLFADQGQSPTEHQTSILQALSLMNGRLVSDATSLQTSQTLVAIAECPLFDTTAKIEALYLAALGRPPRGEELERLVRHVAAAASPRTENEALADIFWALLNSSEFMFNH